MPFKSSQSRPGGGQPLVNSMNTEQMEKSNLISRGEYSVQKGIDPASDPETVIAHEPAMNPDLKSSDELISTLSRPKLEGEIITMPPNDPEMTGRCSRVIRPRDGGNLEKAS